MDDVEDRQRKAVERAKKKAEKDDESSDDEKDSKKKSSQASDDIIGEIEGADDENPKKEAPKSIAQISKEIAVRK